MPLEKRGTIESAGHSGKPRVVRKIEQGQRVQELEEAAPIAMPEDPADADTEPPGTAFVVDPSFGRKEKE